jgi:SAM-dependent methyltransferase
MLSTLWQRGEDRRARRALVRQREYQEQKARTVRPYLDRHTSGLRAQAQRLRARLESFGAWNPDAPILEVGSGAHGFVFFLDHPRAVGVDPLAHDYQRLFPEWQAAASTLTAAGEALPFRDGAFPLVISDNVVDHARHPRQIVTELVRVLAPGGLLYFTVNHHHPLYGLASRLQGAVAAANLSFEVGPFADHTVHLTRAEARALFAGLPLTVLAETDGITQARQQARHLRRAVDLPKRLFYKNAQLELIARKPAAA